MRLQILILAFLFYASPSVAQPVDCEIDPSQSDCVRATADTTYDRCIDASNKSEQKCTPPTDITNAIMGYGNSLQSGDVNGACKKMAILDALAATVSVVFGRNCGGAASQCLTDCDVARSTLNQYRRMPATTPREQREYGKMLEEAERSRSQCMNDKGTSISSYIQAAVSGYAGVMNLKCAKDAAGAADEGCETPEKQAKNKYCPLFCTFVENKDHDQCNCNNPAYADTTVCFCKVADKNTSAYTSRCTLPTVNVPGGSASAKTATLGTNGLAGGLDIPNTDELNPLEEDIAGGIDQSWNPSGGGSGKGASATYGDQGGGGVAALGGGAGGGSGGGGSGGAEAGPYNTDISKGYTNGGGTAASGGGGGYGVPAAGGGYGRDKEKEGGFDWKSLIPKVGKNRGPAGVDPNLFNNGITAANGLTNFEKVTRKMNEKRQSLLP